jgi:hypothetical protein
VNKDMGWRVEFLARFLNGDEYGKHTPKLFLYPKEVLTLRLHPYEISL